MSHADELRSTAQALVAEGISKALITTETGLVDAASDAWTLPRVGLHDDVSRTSVELADRLARALRAR